MKHLAEFDVVIFGATGYTGRLVAEHLARRIPSRGLLRWALAGRSLDRLAATKREVGAVPHVGLIVADATDPSSLHDMVARTRLVVSTAGPYQHHGSELILACAQAGTDYLDLCGEPLWMRQMIDRHEKTAQQSGARILFSCGFDSLPSELGVWFCQQVATRRLGAPVPRIKGRLRSFVGGVSGGSVVTGAATMAAVAADADLAALLSDPFCLTPGFHGPQQPSVTAEEIDPDVGKVGPFMLGPTNAKSVHRSNFVLGHPYGTEFVYDELLLADLVKMPTAGPGGAPPPNLPKPGEGPSRESRENGAFELLFIGIAADGRQVRTSVKGTKDPGYGSTSMMLAEAALCLLDADDVQPGMWVPGAALQQRLIDCLERHAGMRFNDETPPVVSPGPR
jgi:short subunit dehydrogenase-like uncharacterized protein